MTNDGPDAMTEISQAIARDILTLAELSDTDWDTYSMVAEVSDSSVKMTAYRYTETGPPVPTAAMPDDMYPFLVLRNSTRGSDGQAWDVVIVKVHRGTANLVMNFVSGEAADMWRVRPHNIAHLPEALRPRKEDFEPVEEV